MKLKELIKKYYQKLIVEALVKAISVGFSSGLILALIIKVISFIIQSDLTLISISSGLGVAIIGSILLYLFKFKPSIEEVSSRVDALGLDERVITMLDIERKNLDSFIAKKQQDDAKDKLGKVSSKQLKLKLLTLPTLVCLLLVPITVGSLTISLSSDNPPDSSIVPSDEDQEIIEEIEKIREIIRNADIYNIQKTELFDMVDALIGRLKDYQTLEEKKADVKRTKDQIIEKIEDFIISNLLDVLRGLIDDAEIRKSFKETLHDKVDEFEVNIKKVNTLNKKIEETRKFVDELLELIIEEAVDELKDIVAEAEVSQEIKDIAYGMISDLEDRIANVHETYNEKMEDIKETKEEILKLLIPPPQEGEEPDPGPSTSTDELDELGEDMQDAIDDALEDLEDLIDEKGEEELEGQLPDESLEEEEEDEDGDGEEGNNEDGEESDKIPPPPKDGDIHEDYIIDGVTPYLPELEKVLPGITDLLAQGEISEELKQLIESYLELIRKNTES